MSIFENAIQSGVDGIIVTLPDLNAFDAPVANALARGIPVIATNTDDTSGDNPRRAWRTWISGTSPPATSWARRSSS